MTLISMYVSLVQAIGPARRAAEQGQLLCSGRARGDALKGVPKHDPAGAHLLDGDLLLAPPDPRRGFSSGRRPDRPSPAASRNGPRSASGAAAASVQTPRPR